MMLDPEKSHKEAQKAHNDLANTFVLFVLLCGKSGILAAERVEIQFRADCDVGLQHGLHLFQGVLVILFRV
jgi:hypothetical protein